MSGNAQILNACKHVQLRHVYRAERINLVGEFNDVKIEPSALSPTSRCSAPLVANSLHRIANRTWQVGRERTSAHTSCVGLYDSDRGLNSLGRHTESSADSTNCGA